MMDWCFIAGLFTGSLITGALALAAAVSEWIWQFKE